MFLLKVVLGMELGKVLSKVFKPATSTDVEGRVTSLGYCYGTQIFNCYNKEALYPYYGNLIW